jgi:dCMP deaminase
MDKDDYSLYRSIINIFRSELMREHKQLTAKEAYCMAFDAVAKQQNMPYDQFKKEFYEVFTSQVAAGRRKKQARTSFIKKTAMAKTNMVALAQKLTPRQAKQPRQDWDSYFMDLAKAIAKRSTCDRAIVGCLLTKERRILTTGFNGSPTGQNHCDEVGHLMVGGHCVRSVHAEMNAIIQAALHGVSTEGATCYVTHLPCIICTKMLINAGIVRIVYEERYRPDQNALDFLKTGGIELVHL